MTSTVGIVGSTGAYTAPVIPASATAATGSAPASTAALLQNPKVVLDPAAGFITEYLSANGSQVVSQSPSAITVAYLRDGLTADGLTRPPSYGGPVATVA